MKHISKFSTPILVFFLAVIGNSCSYGMKSSAADRFSKDQCEIKLSKDTDSVKLISTCEKIFSQDSERVLDLVQRTRVFYRNGLASSQISAGIEMIDEALKVAAEGGVFKQAHGSSLPSEGDGFWKRPGYVFIGNDVNQLKIVFYIGSASVVISRLENGSIAANYVVY